MGVGEIAVEWGKSGHPRLHVGITRIKIELMIKPAADLCNSMQFSTHEIKIASNRSFDYIVCHLTKILKKRYYLK